SLPGQNGQNPPFILMGSRAKSVGRLARSVEMITQRPVTGSFLSSGTNESFHRSEAEMGRKTFKFGWYEWLYVAKYVFYDKVKAFLNKVICRGRQSPVEARAFRPAKKADH